MPAVPAVTGERAHRSSLRMAIPSKGRMAEDTLDLLKVTSLIVCLFSGYKDIVESLLPHSCGLGPWLCTRHVTRGYEGFVHVM